MKTDDWESWQWQLSNSIKKVEDLKNVLDLLDEEKIEQVSNLPLRITPYFLELIKKYPILRRTVVPTINEFKISDEENNDPLEEDKYKHGCVIHKYPDRCLLLATNSCSTYCRYCTRSRVVGGHINFGKKDIDDGIEYIKNHQEIRDVIISGGDPFTMSDGNLEWLLQKIRSIKHIEIIRIGTKVPVVLPMRITTKLCDMLKKYGPVYINIHFTHALEITQECKDACNKLADAGLVLGSQTVLLKGINDDVEVLKNLFHELLKIRVKPYYLYQMDRINGGSHFRCDLDVMIDIMKKSIGFTSGFPECIIDTEIGKIPLRFDYVTKNENGKYILTSFEKGKSIEY